MILKIGGRDSGAWLSSQLGISTDKQSLRFFSRLAFRTPGQEKQLLAMVVWSFGLGRPGWK